MTRFQSAMGQGLTKGLEPRARALPVRMTDAVGWDGARSMLRALRGCGRATEAGHRGHYASSERDRGERPQVRGLVAG